MESISQIANLNDIDSKYVNSHFSIKNVAEDFNNTKDLINLGTIFEDNNIHQIEDVRAYGRRKQSTFKINSKKSMRKGYSSNAVELIRNSNKKLL